MGLGREKRKVKEVFSKGKSINHIVILHSLVFAINASFSFSLSLPAYFHQFRYFNKDQDFTNKLLM